MISEDYIFEILRDMWEFGGYLEIFVVYRLTVCPILTVSSWCLSWCLSIGRANLCERSIILINLIYVLINTQIYFCFMLLTGGFVIFWKPEQRSWLINQKIIPLFFRSLSALE